MRLLVAGCGDLGTELGLRAAADGHTVWGLRRRPEMLPAAITPLAGDLTGGLPALPGGLDALVLTTAADGRDEDAYRRAYLDGPARLLAAVDAAPGPAPRVLLVSSSGVYDVVDGSLVDETTPAEPATAPGRVLREAERQVLARPGGLVLRLAGIYGPGRTRLIDRVRDGVAVAPDPDVHTNRIHRDDAARAVLHLLGALEDPSGVWLGVDDDPAPRSQVLDFLADELGVVRPPRGPVGRSRGGDKRLSNARLVASGFTLTFPTYREGYRAVLAGQGRRHP